MMHQTSKQLKSNAKGILLGRYGLPMGALVLTLGITFLLENLITLVIPTSTGGYLITYLALLIVSIFSSLLDTGYSYLMLNMARGKQYKLSDLLYVFQTMPDHVILLSLRIFLLTFGCMIPMSIGMVLLIFQPEALIFRIVFVLLLLVSFALSLKVSLDYSQIYFIYLDNPYLSTKEVMAESKAMMKGNRWRYFYLNLSFIGMMILGVLSFFIGYLWITPYMTMTTVEFYRDLIGETSTSSENTF